MVSDEIGAVIRNARKTRALSQRELAKRLGMSQSTISQLECGIISDLGFRKIERICAVLELEIQIIPRPVETFESLMEKNEREREKALQATEAIIAHFLPVVNPPT